MSLSKTDTDIILNKANIALARSQRLVASWLPTQPAPEDNEKSETELRREEDEIFTAVPETLGLGAPLPSKAADGSWNRTELDSNDQLRKQLLGRNYKKVMAEKARQQKGAETGPGSAAKNPVAKGSSYQQRGSESRNEDDEDEEDEGRTASIGKKNLSKKRKVNGNAESTTQTEGESKNEDSDGDEEKTASARPQPKAKGKKKATSYLDEILAERSKKRKKR